MSHIPKEHVSLVVRSGLRFQRIPCSKPDCTQAHPYMWTWCVLSLMSRVKRPLLSVERRCHVRRRLRHLTAVKNDEVRPKIALVFLQNRALI
ncbi:hypothetical protein AVEN_103046-1 [Araneus ventricosus]|uniref:Uncharacterized protein n=1 Tax=Araneus ventricosus TaxID=182803 RepID=A0A4Y2B9E9_ARAVE|nr:hypothetical protein AVEN_103046-1 [Araneus ventricosus]